MRQSYFPIISILLLLFQGCTHEKSGPDVYDLKCENIIDPEGIGTSVPALSWKISSDMNGTAQKAYQVLVASDTSFLNEKDADLWNSGKVMSSSQIIVPYSGKPLTSRSVCVWKIRIWDENDNLSEWSPSSGFSIGLLDKSDWAASYIGFRENSKLSVSPQFRKSFDLNEEPVKLFLYVNSLGYHEIYLNGKKVGDKVLTPAVSQYNKRSQVITYDISSLANQGRNDIVIWAGKGWYSKGLPGVFYDGPLVRAQIDQYNKDSWNTIIQTDSTWQGRNSGYYTTGTWLPGEFGGEVVDATLLLADMTAASLDKADWSTVSVVNIPDHQATPQLTESNIIADTIKPVLILPLGNNRWFVDMGITLTGWTEIRFEGLKKGEEIMLDYCDHLDKKGKLVDQGQSDKYIAKGVPGEVFRNRFNYHGFRYIKISNLNSEPAKNDIAAYPIRTGYRLASSFSCSDPDMNKIHDMIFYTLQCLSLGGYLVDCPQIERLGYGGDGNASTETAQTMFDMAPLYSNWLQAWADCIRDDGGMPHTAPNPYPAGGGPYWCGFIITASWKTYMNYGDKRILEKYYPSMQKWLGYADKYSSTGLLQPWPETDYRAWYLGDWASPEGTDHTNKASITLVNNCFMAVCYETMQKIAITLDKKNEAERFAARRLNIIKLINKELYNATSKIYGSGTQIDITYPLLAGIVPDSLKDIVRNTLAEVIETDHKGHIATGLVGIPVFTEWSVKNGESDLMYSMLKKRDYPGYLYMIDNGATTTWEHWNGARSRIHNCYNGIGSWFYQSPGGIEKDDNSPAYQHIIINPDIPKGIIWANTSKETPYGPVTVRWSYENDSFRVEFSIPVGSEATVILPEGYQKYTLNDKELRTNSKSEIVGSGKFTLSCFR
jgi:alpha-L-rhamnosidase